MKIIDLHIYGFGQLEDVLIEKLADFQVFYGENEAGKSTIMAFIHAILFGFPTKQQAELRYVPKHGAKYGGRLRLFHSQHGIVSVERVKGKAAIGDLTVTLENGESGGEELLKELLSHIDKGIYQAIFSFNLHGLQNIHQMKGEEIGRFLFSAGTLGTDRLAAAETQLQKELDQRFKASGKKPVLNEKLQELHQLNNELKQAAAKSQSYEFLVGEKEAIQQEIAVLQKRVNDIQTRINKLDDWKKIEAFVKEEKWLEQELRKLGQATFPARGMERYEQLNQLLQPYNAQISSLTERIEQVKKELNIIEPDRIFLESETELQAALDRFPLYNQYIQQEKQVELKISELEERAESIKEKLHWRLNEEEIFSINTNIYVKDQVQKLAKKGVWLDKGKQELEDRFAEEKRRLEDLEEAVNKAKEQLIPEAQRTILESEAAKAVDRNDAENNLKTVQEKIAFYQAANEREKRQKQQKYQQYLLFGILLLALFLYSWSIKQPVLAVLGGIFFIITAVLFVTGLKERQFSAMDQSLEALLKDERKWREQLDSPQYAQIAILQEKLAMDHHRREQLQILHVKLEQQQRLYDKVIDQFEQWEREAVGYNKEIEKISAVLKIPKELANTQLLDAFQHIEQLKGMLREKRQLQVQLERLQKDSKAIAAQLMKIAARYASGHRDDLQKAAYMLRLKLNEEQEKTIQFKEKQNKLNDMESDRMQLIQEKKHLQAELDQLISEANVETETAFFEKAERSARKAKLEERLSDVKQQLHYCLLSELERNSYLQIANCDELVKEHQAEAEKIQLSLNQKHEQLAAKRHEIQLLEEGGVYSEIFHRFKQKQNELTEEAKEWAVYRFAQDILSQTVEKYKNIHLPRMLAQAENYLSFLTDGHYRKIHLHPAKTGFLIEREDHTIFEANELSQATTEQVYVSIRLALATTLYERFKFPIMIDDSFVNFDAKRTQKVMELLKQLKQNQILFFTCHQHLLDYFSNTSTLFLQKGAIQQVY
ncbi:AAA family ATPase [Bacillota bacterium Lsc_1132]